LKSNIQHINAPTPDEKGEIVWVDRIKPGSVYENYRINKFLTMGGMTYVYEAEDTRPGNNKKYAFKEIRKHTDELTQLTNSEQEILTLSGLLQSIDHPNIVHVFDLSLDREELINTKSGNKEIYYRIYLVEEFIEGKSLSKIFEENGYKPLKEEDVLKWAIQLCDAVTYLQARKIIHRDIKPGNIILTPTGSIKLTDFGIARVFKEEKWEDFVNGLGGGDTFGHETREFSPPEQSNGATFFGSDVFSIGATICVLLGGQNAVEFVKKRADWGVHQSQPFPMVSLRNKKLWYVIAKAVELDYNKRYQKASEMLKDLQSIGRGVAIKVPPLPLSPPSPPTFTSPQNRTIVEMLISTQNGTTVSGDYITFKWTKVQDADYYSLQISDSPYFRNVICDEKLFTNSYQIRTDALLSGRYSGTYYIRISSVNKNGASNWDEISFGIKTYVSCSLQCNNRNCPRKFPLPLQEAYCEEGKPLEPLTKKCPRCGTYNASSAKYCIKCGEPL
jgi:serine/threonine protein kinase